MMTPIENRKAAKPPPTINNFLSIGLVMFCKNTFRFFFTLLHILVALQLMHNKFSNEKQEMTFQITDFKN